MTNNAVKEPLNPTDKETQLVAMFVGMFFDQAINKERMLRLLTPWNLARTYEFMEARGK